MSRFLVVGEFAGKRRKGGLSYAPWIVKPPPKEGAKKKGALAGEGGGGGEMEVESEGREAKEMELGEEAGVVDSFVHLFSRLPAVKRAFKKLHSEGGDEAVRTFFGVKTAMVRTRTGSTVEQDISTLPSLLRFMVRAAPGPAPKQAAATAPKLNESALVNTSRLKQALQEQLDAISHPTRRKILRINMMHPFSYNWRLRFADLLIERREGGECATLGGYLYDCAQGNVSDTTAEMFDDDESMRKMSSATAKLYLNRVFPWTLALGHLYNHDNSLESIIAEEKKQKKTDREKKK